MVKKKIETIIENNVSKEVIQKMVPDVEDYSSIDLTESEKKSISEITGLFQTHLKDNYDMVPDLNSRSIVPTGINVLDSILGGGMGSGLVMVVGMPGAGKSALAAHVLSVGQKKWPGKFLGMYLDSEDITTEKRLRQLGVHDVKPYSSISVERVFKAIDGMCSKKDDLKVKDIPSVIVWDSIANTNPEKAETEDDMNKLMGLKAKMLSFFLPKYVPKMADYNITLLAINQLRSKIDTSIFKSPAALRFLPNDEIPGGRSILFNSIQLLYLRAVGDIQGEYGFHGSRVLCKAVKNKLFSPNIVIDMVLNFDKGFNNLYTNFELLKKTKRIVHHHKGWYKLVSFPEQKFTQTRLTKIFRESSEFKKAFSDELRDVLQTEYLDKYLDNDDPYGEDIVDESEDESIIIPESEIF